MNEEQDYPALPKGWVLAEIREIGEVVTGKTPKKSNPDYYDDTYPFFKPADLNSGYYVKTAADGLSEKGINQSRLLPEKSTLVTCIGATIGKTGFIRVKGASNQQINAIMPHKNILSEFVYFYCISPQFQKEIINNYSSTTLPILNKSKFQNLPIVFPSFLEQGRIVSKLEELFTKLDAGIRSLQNIKIQLQLYRQAVLKHAFHGKLVDQDSNDKKVIEVLEKVKTDKEKMEKDKIIRKQKSLPPFAEHDVPFESPKGWIWVRLIDLIALEKNAMKRGPFGGSLKKEIFVKNGYLVYEQRHAIHNDFNYAKYFITPQKFQEMINFKVEPGDLIISCSGVTLGKIAEIPTKAKKGIINQALLKINLNSKLVRNDFFIYFFNSGIYQNQIFDKAKGSAIPNMVAVEQLKKTLIVIPPLEEQKRLVLELDYHFSLIRDLNKTVQNALIQSNQLRQSILKMAFKGKLVSQNSNDESAEKLLELIRKEKKHNNNKKILIRTNDKRKQRSLIGYVE